MLGVAVPHPEFFWAYWYMYRDWDFNKSIGEHIFRQTNPQQLWLYLVAFEPKLFFQFFVITFFFYCLKRAYETLKQNLDKFKHSSHELRSWTILVSLNGTDDANLWPFSIKTLFFNSFLWILGNKKLNFGTSFRWAVWKILNHHQFMCSVFRTCCKSLFFVMEFLYSTKTLTHIFSYFSYKSVTLIKICHQDFYH